MASSSGSLDPQAAPARAKMTLQSGRRRVVAAPWLIARRHGEQNKWTGEALASFGESLHDS